jgi:hypothetical protein
VSRTWRLVLVVILVAVAAGCSSSEPVGTPPVDRVLVVSMPGVTWSDVRGADLPVLEAFIDDAAIGDISTRIGRRRASSTDAYLTIGAGTRALAPSVDVAVALDPDEVYSGVPAASILRRRLGDVPEGVAYLAAGAAIDRNAGSSFGAEPGLLGDRLAEAGVHRAVIANADAAEGFVSDEPPPDGAYARGAATALMGADGIVPGGRVGRELLQEDPLAPFGRRLDQGAVVEAFAEAWGSGPRRVVLVEASDLSRAAAYRPRATPEQHRALEQDALADADRLLGALLNEVDPQTDAVLVLSPVTSGSPELGMVALRAPGTVPGLLRSPTTRRDGYVQLADVAPTMLALLGEPVPDEIEGRAFEVSPPGDEDRIERLVDGAAAAGFRDDVIAGVTATVVAALALLALGTAVRHRLPRRAVPWLRVGSLVALGVVPATFLAPQVPAARDGAVGYTAFVVVTALVLGAAYLALDRWRPGLGAIGGVGATVALIVGDVLYGAPLQVNAVFGYSLAVAGRFAGLGNLAFALFGAATVVLGALLADRYGRRGRILAVILFVLVVLVEGLPMLGADVGGVVSMVPAFGTTAMVLWGRRIGARDAAVLAVVTVLSVLAFAFVDVGRPAGSQTHLARLAEHVLDRRWGNFVDTLSRRLQASFGSADVALTALVLALIVGVSVLAHLTASGRAQRLRRAGRRRGPGTAAAYGLAVLAVVGLVANDSSVAVPATMLIIVVPVLVLRRLDHAEAA